LSDPDYNDNWRKVRPFTYRRLHAFVNYIHAPQATC